VYAAKLNVVQHWQAGITAETVLMYRDCSIHYYVDMTSDCDPTTTVSCVTMKAILYKAIHVQTIIWLLPHS